MPSKTFSTARKLAAFGFLLWALGCAAMLWVQCSILCPGTPVSFLFSDDFLLRSNSYLLGSAAYAMAAAGLLIFVKAPGRKARWWLFASSAAVAGIAFTFRGVHLALAFAAVPVLVSLRLALIEGERSGGVPSTPSGLG